MGNVDFTAIKKNSYITNFTMPKTLCSIPIL